MQAGDDAPRTRLVPTFRQVDLSGLGMPMVVLYDRPRDFPHACVARVWDLGMPTDVAVARATMRELRDDVEGAFPHMAFVGRLHGDDPCIRGCYL